MLCSLNDVIAVRGIEPARRIELSQGKFIREMDSLKCAAAQKLMVTDQAAVRIQSNPDTREDCEHPARLSELPRRLQIKTVKGQVFCPEQSPHFQGQKCRNAGASQSHQEWDQCVNAAHSHETSKKNESADDFFRPR